MPQNRKLCDDDLKYIVKFCDIFKIKNTRPLFKEISNYLDNNTLDGERKITKELCYLFADERNTVLKHYFWDSIRIEAGKTAYNIDFEMSVEDTFR